jgi:acyl-coenzyme A thioesterase PaaI-like protein
MLCGPLAMRAFTERVSVTLELDVHLYRPAPASGTVTAVARKVKAVRSVFVGEVKRVIAEIGAARLRMAGRLSGRLDGAPR